MKSCSQKPGKASKPKSYEPPKWDFGHKIRNFRRITDIQNLREALRTKITLDYRETFTTMLNENNNENAQECKDIVAFQTKLEPIAEKWRESYLHKAMSRLEKLEKAYEVTSRLQKELEEIKNRKIVINMRILYLENDLVRYTVMQNFQYLMQDHEWRVEHDWIHRNEDNHLEPFPESIEKRGKLFIRVRDNDDAFLVKKFFNENFSPNCHELLTPYKDPDEFLTEIGAVQEKTVRGLLELHLAMWLQANVTKEFRDFEQTSMKKLNKQKRNVSLRCDRKYFTEFRTQDLKLITDACITGDLKNSYQNRAANKFDGVLDTILTLLLPPRERKAILTTFSAWEKISFIERQVNDLLVVIDSLPIKILKPIEKKVRTKHETQMRIAKRTCEVELQMQNMIKSVKKNMEPPFKKPPLQRPLPRSRLPPRPKKPKTPPPKLTDREKCFLEAFASHETTQTNVNTPENRKILKLVENACMPFHYDHFLSLIGYVPETDFVTMVQRRDGDESDRFKYKDVLPTVKVRLKQWERTRELVKKYQIEQTAHLYEEFQRNS